MFLLSLNTNAQCPKSRAWVGGRLSGAFVKIVLQNQDRINADRFCEGIRRTTQVDSFSIIIIRDSTIIFRSQNIGNLFDNNFKKQIEKIQINDKMLLFNIWGTDYDGKKVFLDPLEFWVTEY
jgi:hypothetical protein